MSMFSLKALVYERKYNYARYGFYVINHTLRNKVITVNFTIRTDKMHIISKMLCRMFVTQTRKKVIEIMNRWEDCYIFVHKILSSLSSLKRFSLLIHGFTLLENWIEYCEGKQKTKSKFIPHSIRKPVWKST